MRKHSHTTARIEKKMSTTAKSLLLALCPNISDKDYTIEEDSFRSYRGTVYHDQWVVWFGLDCWGESDCYDCWCLLDSWLIDNTTDWQGMSKAEEANGWREGVDLTPFYSPWRSASRAAIIRHCRNLVRTSVK